MGNTTTREQYKLGVVGGRISLYRADVLYEDTDICSEDPLYPEVLKYIELSVYVDIVIDVPTKRLVSIKPSNMTLKLEIVDIEDVPGTDYVALNLGSECYCYGCRPYARKDMNLSTTHTYNATYDYVNIDGVKKVIIEVVII